MPPDSSEVDAALAAKLLADGALMAIATDGVFFDEASQGKTKFVIISLVTENDEPMFNARAYEDATYLVKYVEQGTSGLNAKAAAARIDAVLDNQPLTVTGYKLMMMQRVERVRITEVDEIDNSIRWQHRGGRYQVVVSS
jgi:hypothetical protein